jgi:hypothetical protein
MDELNLEVVEEAAEEIRGRELKYSLEERFWDHDLICVGGWDFFILDWPPLEDGTRGKKMIIN